MPCTLYRPLESRLAKTDGVMERLGFDVRDRPEGPVPAERYEV